MDATKNQTTVRVVLLPQGDYLDQANLAFGKPVRLTIFGQTSGAISRDFKPGEPIGAIEVPIYVDGSTGTYPLDRYTYGYPRDYESAPFLVLSDLGQAGKVTSPVPMGMTGGIGGINRWAPDWALSVDGNALLVALVPLRNFLPGSPPIGSLTTWGVAGGAGDNLAALQVDKSRHRPVAQPHA